MHVLHAQPRVKAAASPDCLSAAASSELCRCMLGERLALWVDVSSRERLCLPGSGGRPPRSAVDACRAAAAPESDSGTSDKHPPGGLLLERWSSGRICCFNGTRIRGGGPAPARGLPTSPAASWPAAGPGTRLA
jgi:hypothetical protein